MKRMLREVTSFKMVGIERLAKRGCEWVSKLENAISRRAVFCKLKNSGKSVNSRPVTHGKLE